MEIYFDIQSYPSEDDMDCHGLADKEEYDNNPLPVETDSDTKDDSQMDYREGEERDLDGVWEDGNGETDTSSDCENYFDISINDYENDNDGLSLIVNDHWRFVINEN